MIAKNDNLYLLSWGGKLCAVDGGCFLTLTTTNILSFLPLFGTTTMEAWDRDRNKGSPGRDSHPVLPPGELHS